MGLQARSVPSRVIGDGKDVEKASLLSLPPRPSSASDNGIALPLDDDDDDLNEKEHRLNEWYNKEIFKALKVMGSIFTFAIALNLIIFKVFFPFPSPAPTPIPSYIQYGIEQCSIISRPTPSFKPFDSRRKYSDRYVEGTKSVWLKNGTIWTGEKDGTDIIYGGDVWLEGGVVRKIGKSDDVKDLIKSRKDVEEVELNGAWVTPGIVDTHSHMGVDAAPALKGSDDTNSLKADAQPWLRSLDGINTHDLAYNLSISGGITTALILPGSAGSIGGNAFIIKPRWTAENTPQSMQVEPPWTIDPTKGNGTWERTHSWRHIKHACGENPKRVYGNVRMDNIYDFRKAYTEGKNLKEKQDRWCSSPKTQTEPFPESLEWETLADVIRGNVKVNIHCYETVDLNDLVRLSNEFQFPIATFHHAHEVYLVPDLLRQAWGHVPPAVAIFATNARYKRESYRGSEYAPKILADNGLNVIMKSDHPVLDSRYLVYEAATAHHYGLNYSQAISSVTTHPAKAMGIDHRIGFIRPGYDADIVVWDSFPLTLGATPKQTYIDGIPQIINPYVVEKPAEAQEISPAGKYDKEANEAVQSRGDPDLRSKKSAKNIIFQDVGAFFLPSTATSIQGQVIDLKEGGKGNVVVTDGEITCVGSCVVENDLDFEVVDLKGGSIAPGLITVGSDLGVIEITQEKSTADGYAFDPVEGGSDVYDGLIVHGVDGAQFDGKDELLAYRAGVTTGVVAPKSQSFIAGISFAFSTGALHPLSEGAIQHSAAALHINLGNSKNSVSTKIAILRRLLRGELDEKTELTEVFKKISKGEFRLVIRVDKADVIAAIVRLKREVAKDAQITILGGQESWMVAEDLAKEDIGVIVTPARSYPADWDSRRIMPGLPLSNHSLPSFLASHGVMVGLGIEEAWSARNARYDAAWTFANAPSGTFSKQAALDLVSSNLEQLLGLDQEHLLLTEDAMTKAKNQAWVAYEGDLFTFGARVRGVKAAGKDEVDLF